MICKVIKNRYETTMDSINLDIIKLIKNPIVAAKKDDSPLFNLSYNQVTSPTKRAGFNHGGSEWLVLDFDNGLTMLEFKEKYFELFHNYYLMWTSYSSTPDKQKFRFITKLDRVYSDVEWKAMTPSLKRYFPDNDSCSFQTSRFFACPSVADDKSYIHEFNTQPQKLNLLEMLKIDSGFLTLLVSRIKDKSDNIEVQPVAPCKSVIGYTAVGNLTVLQWLETKWNTDGSGNGGMFHRGLYGALSVAVKYSDFETVGKIRNACARVGESKRFDKTLRDVQ